MRWHHRIARAYWLHVRLKRYPQYARKLGPDAEIGDQLRLANQLVWPLARSAFLLHCVDDLSYAEIATRAGVDTRTVELCIGDAIYSMTLICDEFRETPG
ncbi:sigma factor-like helix-turn-helix DNA-binding protein [Sphingopyxis sp. R3-92]|uniref:sigma-70 region 4 domain-containing protein n=1 Tax=Sphingopyxis sp. R3-92 TaxID=3158553 RepID=UPI003EE4A7FB